MSGLTIAKLEEIAAAMKPDRPIVVAVAMSGDRVKRLRDEAAASAGILSGACGTINGIEIIVDHRLTGNKAVPLYSREEVARYLAEINGTLSGAPAGQQPNQ